MATGDPVVQLLRIMPPRASNAYLNSIAGASTPAENILVWLFADAADRYLDLLFALHGYDAGGLTLRFGHGAAGATGNVRISAAIRRIEDDLEDLDTTAHTYDFNAATFTVPTAVGEVAYDEVTFTDGADMDGILNNEFGILRIRRQPADAADTLANSWYLHAVTGRET